MNEIKKNTMVHNVAVVILNYNTSSDCQKCVRDLKKQQGVTLELIIVDNKSVVSELEQVKALCQEQGCTFLPALENRGYNAGNNIGLRYAAEKGYRYVLIANPDMEFPEMDYIERLVSVMENDNSVVVCGSDIVSPEGVHQNPMKRDGDWRESFDWVTGLLKKPQHEAQDFVSDFRESHYCHKVSGCCLLLRLDFIKSLGYFDEHVFLYCEEAILSRQVEQAGKRMYYLATTSAVHRHIKSEKGNPVPRLKAWRKSRMYFVRQYSGDTRFGQWLSITSQWLYLTLVVGVNQVKRLLRCFR